MAFVIVPHRFVVKRDTAANFAAANTLLLDGEFGLETDTERAKMGDGVTPWNSITEYQLPGTYDLTGLVEGSRMKWDATAGKWVVDNSTPLESVVAGDGIDVDVTDPFNPVVSIEDTAVTPGSYTNADITVGADGRLTAAANGAAPTTYTGTTNRITVTGSVIDIAATYVGQASITTLGAVTTGSWTATVIGATYGGTGQTAYTVGDILYASSTTALSKLAAGTATHVLTSNGAGAAPSWQAASGGGGGSGDIFYPNFYTVRSQAAASQVGLSLTTQGGAQSLPAPTNTNVFTSLARIPFQTAAATNAVTSFYSSDAASIWRGNATGCGGFNIKFRFGHHSGLSNTSCRCFAGVTGAAGGSSDVDPSTIVSMIGMGWDSADTNIQVMHNDASGTATKIDLGASFPVPIVSQEEVYELTLSCTPSGSSVDYTVKRLSNGATATGTISSDLPANNIFLTQRVFMSAGGVSSVTGLALMFMGVKYGE